MSRPRRIVNALCELFIAWPFVLAYELAGRIADRRICRFPNETDQTND